MFAFETRQHANEERDDHEDDDAGDDPEDDLVAFGFLERLGDGFFDGAVMFFCAGAGLFEAAAEAHVVGGVGVGEGLADVLTAVAQAVRIVGLVRLEALLVVVRIVRHYAVCS